MHPILAVLLVLLALESPARGDVILPGHKSVSHELVLVGSELWTDQQIVAFPVRGFHGTHVVEPGVPFSFSSKYGTRLYVVAGSETIPAEPEGTWKAEHLGAEIPVSEVSSVPIASPIESIVTTLRIRALDSARFELEVQAQEKERDFKLLAAMGAAAALGLLGLTLVLRRRRRAATAA